MLSKSVAINYECIFSSLYIIKHILKELVRLNCFVGYYMPTFIYLE